MTPGVSFDVVAPRPVQRPRRGPVDAAEVLRHIGLDFMAEDARQAIVASSFLDAGKQVQHNADVLQVIGRRRVVA